MVDSCLKFVAKIVVFDSGLGSLSIIKAIQKITKSEIIYFADQKNYPYGKKSKSQLNDIIKKTISLVEQKFSPEIIVMASNTPSLILKIKNSKLVNVKPPIKEACKISKSKKIAILATRASVKSNGLTNYIKENKIKNEYTIFKIDGTKLVDLVESGKFLTNKNYSKKIIKKTLEKIILEKQIDTITLSSTHLSFLKKILQKEFPSVKFLDPNDVVAKRILKLIQNKKEKRNSLRIFSSTKSKKLKNNLEKLGIKNKISFLSY